MNRQRWLGPVLLFAAVLAVAAGLAAWKYLSFREAMAAFANQPEPSESVVVARAKKIEHRRTTTSIGTVLALRSITLRTSWRAPCTTCELTPGQVVDTGDVLVTLDVSVEEAELKAQRSAGRVAETMLATVERASRNSAASAIDVDRARAERDVALAQVARTKA